MLQVVRNDRAVRGLHPGEDLGDGDIALETDPASRTK